MNEKARVIVDELRNRWVMQDAAMLENPLLCLLKRLEAVKNPFVPRTWMEPPYSRMVLTGCVNHSNNPIIEIMVGELTAVEPGIVVFSPSPAAVSLFDGECGLIVRSENEQRDGLPFSLLSIPETRNEWRFRIAMGFLKSAEVGAILVDRQLVSDSGVMKLWTARMSEHRWNNELYPWLDKHLPA